MKPPRIGTEWERHDGTRLRVSVIEGRHVICTVTRRGQHMGSGRRRCRELTLVRSDFNAELGNTFLRRIA